MVEIPKPMAVLELGDGQSTTFRVLRFARWPGQVIFPGHAPQGKTISVLRVEVPAVDKPFPPYWDITQTKLIARLEPVLSILQGTGRRVTITAHGVPPKKDFSVDVEGA